MKRYVFHFFVLGLVASCAPGGPFDNGGDGGVVPPPSLVADHRAVAAFDRIPEQYRAAVRQMLVSVPGESHGQAYLYGPRLIAREEPGCAAVVAWNGAPPNREDSLVVFKALRTGDRWQTYSGEEHIWTSDAAVAQVNGHFAYCRDGLGRTISAFAFGWCWDMTADNGPGGDPDPLYGVRWAGRTYTLDGRDHGIWGLDAKDGELTGNALCMDTYLDAMERFIAANPGSSLVFTTGPVDGEGNRGERGYQRAVKHDHIRAYVRRNGRVLFDYADILCWNEAGAESVATWNGITYQVIDPAYVGEYNGGDGSCHINEEGCRRIGKALWWLLARLAGWNGE